MIKATAKPILPLGTVTLALLLVAVLVQWWPESSCQTLEKKMQKGFFLRWMPPQLVLLTADKKSLTVEADSKELACEKLLKQL